MQTNGGLSARTLRTAWREGAARLRQAGVEEADANAELLLLYLLGKSKAELLRDWPEPFPDATLRMLAQVRAAT